MDLPVLLIGAALLVAVGFVAVFVVSLVGFLATPFAGVSFASFDTPGTPASTVAPVSLASPSTGASSTTGTSWPSSSWVPLFVSERTGSLLPSACSSVTSAASVLRSATPSWSSPTSSTLGTTTGCSTSDIDAKGWFASDEARNVERCHKKSRTRKRVSFLNSLRDLRPRRTQKYIGTSRAPLLLTSTTCTFLDVERALMADVHEQDNDAGNGRIELTLNGREAVFSNLSYRYPLKLLSPRIYEPTVAIAYVLSYGGGLVGGDRIHLAIKIHSDATLMLLTQVSIRLSPPVCPKISLYAHVQGSTKVFKQRPGQRLARVRAVPQDIYGSHTTQRMSVDIDKGGLLLLLPDPVTCFSGAAYNQFQSFNLSEGASVVVLDWFTSGRMSRGEEWQFSRYYSVNEVWLNTRRIVRDALALHEEDTDISHRRALRDRMGGYHCYAMLIISGDKVKSLLDRFTGLYRRISVYQQNNPDFLIWSLSMIDSGCVVRVAGKETELVKNWLREQLGGLEDIVGSDVYSKAFV